jgi:hypothetical protein
MTQETDRELLELAAKAAGLELNWAYEPIADVVSNAGWFASIVDTNRIWNPLTDDGDALRLAVKLGLLIVCNEPILTGSFEEAPGTEVYGGGVGEEKAITREIHGADPYAATRRAITRAAAEIGRAM